MTNGIENKIFPFIVNFDNTSSLKCHYTHHVICKGQLTPLFRIPVQGCDSQMFRMRLTGEKFF